ncbi:MAG: DUF1016 family protein [Bacteroidales bacterium]|nr:DUF1016 family protein [Bacteroidales bacterium]
MKSIVFDPNRNQQYQNLLTRVINQAKVTQYRSCVGVNQQLIRLYWFIGEEISKLKADAKWGGKFFSQFSHDLTESFPDMKGFSTRNLQYIKQMYDTFSSKEITPQAVAQLQKANLPSVNNEFTNSPIDYVSLVPWGHIRFILDKDFSPEKSFYYILKTIEYGWSRNMLLNMMASELYESEGKTINNFPTTLPKNDSDYASEMLKSPYHLDFLNLRKDFKEKELQKGLEDNISRFLIELGNGFAFVGRQIRLEINGDEFFCDLLFYHLRLRRYIVVELKTGKFEPEYVSKLNLYCTAVDHIYKTDLDGDTIGLLFCKEKNDLVAQWTVEKNEQPIAITRYELKKLLRNNHLRSKATHIPTD